MKIYVVTKMEGEFPDEYCWGIVCAYHSKELAEDHAKTLQESPLNKEEGWGDKYDPATNTINPVEGHV